MLPITHAAIMTVNNPNCVQDMHRFFTPDVVTRESHETETNDRQITVIAECVWDALQASEPARTYCSEPVHPGYWYEHVGMFMGSEVLVLRKRPAVSGFARLRRWLRESLRRRVALVSCNG